MSRYMSAMANGGFARSASPDQPLTDAELHRAVPSIFATEPHESRSERFAYIPTVQVLDGLRREGFQPFFAQQGRSRIPGKAAFTKHLIRLRHPDSVTLRGEVPEVILTNAHDGTASYRMSLGVFKFLCMNGLFAGELYGDVRIRHTGDAVSQVIEGAYQVLGQTESVLDTVETWKGLPVSREAALAYAEAAHVLRFPEPDKAPIEPIRLLSYRRQEEVNDQSLWATFNRVQENAIRGGQHGRVRQADGRIRRASTRAVNGIDQTTALNRALWTLTERMEQLVRQAA